MYNLRMDPYERADITSNTYWDWTLRRAFLIMGAGDRCRVHRHLQGIPATTTAAKLHHRPDHGEIAAADGRLTTERNIREWGDPPNPPIVNEPCGISLGGQTEGDAMTKGDVSIRSVLAGLALFTMLVMATAVYAQVQPGSPKDQDAYAIARDVYFYAYPLVSMDTTMRQATDVPNAHTVNMRAPVNQFAHARTYPNANE